MINKIQYALSSPTLTHHDTTSTHGTLQHLTFVYHDGWKALANLSNFLSKFPNGFVKHHLPIPVRNDLLWWQTVLAASLFTCSIKPLCFLDPDIWVDASSSWGISLVVGTHWATWHLMPGWKGEGCDIGWVEGVTLELAVN